MFDDTYLTLAYPHVSADSCNIQYPETVRSPGNTAGHAVSLSSTPFEPSSVGVIVAWTLIFFSPSISSTRGWDSICKGYSSNCISTEPQSHVVAGYVVSSRSVFLHMYAHTAVWPCFTGTNRRKFFRRVAAGNVPLSGTELIQFTAPITILIALVWDVHCFPINLPYAEVCVIGNLRNRTKLNQWCDNICVFKKPSFKINFIFDSLHKGVNFITFIARKKLLQILFIYLGIIFLPFSTLNKLFPINI